MENAILKVVLDIAAELAVTLIGVLGAWLLAKMAKSEKLKNVKAATEILIEAAETTVMELQQTCVEEWKSQQGGKLTEDQIALLGELLVKKTKDKMTAPAIEALMAVDADIAGMIHGAGEALIAALKE